ncbi:MAG: PIN domain-containing protein [Patescibacteria group bacterium]
MVVDSDILIDFFRDYAKAKTFFLGSNQVMRVSRLSVMEVIKGVVSKRNALKALRQLDELGIEVVEVDAELSEVAGDIFFDYWHKWGIGIVDSFVAATTLKLSDKLVTRNVRHFKNVEGLDLIVPY